MTIKEIEEPDWEHMKAEAERLQKKKEAGEEQLNRLREQLSRRPEEETYFDATVPNERRDHPMGASNTQTSTRSRRPEGDSTFQPSPMWKTPEEKDAWDKKHGVGAYWKRSRDEARIDEITLLEDEIR